MTHSHSDSPSRRSRRLRTILQLAATLVVTLLLVACGSSGLGDILGGGDDSVDRVDEVRGTVRYVDTANRAIDLERASYSSSLRNGGTESGRLYYDADTVVEYDGRTYRPEDLEVGDQIVARVDDTGRDLLAERIEVTYDVTSNDRNNSNDDRYEDRYDDALADLRGTVRYVDTRDQTIELERVDYARSFDRNVSGDRLVLEYDSRTRVEFDGRMYSPDSLEVGDEVAVDVSESGGRYLIDEIEVIRDVRNTYSR